MKNFIKSMLLCSLVLVFFSFGCKTEKYAYQYKCDGFVYDDIYYPISESECEFPENTYRSGIVWKCENPEFYYEVNWINECDFTVKVTEK